MAGFIDKMTYAPKTWGSEVWVVNNDKYCGKILNLNNDGFCSYHYHKIKDEVLLVTEGRVLFVYSVSPVINDSAPGFRQVVLEPGQAWHVKPGIAHQFYGLTDAKITEFSTQHFDDDSYRFTRKFVGDLNITS